MEVVVFPLTSLAKEFKIVKAKISWISESQRIRWLEMYNQKGTLVTQGTQKESGRWLTLYITRNLDWCAGMMLG
jgi:hypothetical protein